MFQLTMWLFCLTVKFFCTHCFLSSCTVCTLPGSSPLRGYPLLSVITRQPPNVQPHLPQPSSPGAASSHLPLISPQLPRGSEPPPSQTPLSISSESETESSTPRLKKPRRSRTIFTELQLMGLEKKFQKQKYLSTPDRLVESKHINHQTVFYITMKIFYIPLIFFLQLTNCI